jgi:hypothetical protein
VGTAERALHVASSGLTCDRKIFARTLLSTAKTRPSSSCCPSRKALRNKTWTDQTARLGVTPRNGQNCTLRASSFTLDESLFSAEIGPLGGVKLDALGAAVSDELANGSPANSHPPGDLPLADTLLK